MFLITDGKAMLSLGRKEHLKSYIDLSRVYAVLYTLKCSHIILYFGYIILSALKSIARFPKTLVS